MKRTIINGLIAGLATTLLAACGGTTDSSSSDSKMLATTAACFAAWNSTTAYNGGAQVSYNGVNYTAAFWTQGNNPSTNNGPSGSGQPWVSNGACGATPTPTPAPTPTPTPAPTPTPTPVPAPTPTPTPTPTGSCPQYVSGHTYATGDKVTNAGGYYQCTVGGWCSTGGAYDPGTGWAWQNAWSQIAASQCGGTPAPTPAPTPTPTPAPTPTPTPAPTPTPTPAPTPTGGLQSFPGGVGTLNQSQNGYTLNFTSQDANLSSTLANNIIRTFFTVFPKEAARFNPNVTHTVSITVDPAYTGVAATGGAKTTISASYIDGHVQDYDVVTHEAMHIAQSYSNGNAPGYWVEGLADYARYVYGVNNSAAGWSLPAYSSSQHYTDAYRVTARFILWLSNHKNSNIPNDLDAKLRSGSFSDATFWPAETGNTVDQLWSQYAANPAL